MAFARPARFSGSNQPVEKRSGYHFFFLVAPKAPFNWIEVQFTKQSTNLSLTARIAPRCSFASSGPKTELSLRGAGCHDAKVRGMSTCDFGEIWYPAAMNITRALRQHMETLQEAGMAQIEHSSPERTAKLSERLSVPSAATPLVAGPPSTRSPSPAPAEKATEVSQERQLSVLCQQVEACTLCPQLVANRTKTVFGVGNPDARVCFFGEGPGADEDRKGEPFVGAAGQLLDKIIVATKMQRSEVYILNTVKCRPPGNRNPEPDELSNCRPFFEQQLEIIQPEFIVCLGKVAASTLLRVESPIGRLRGQFHEWRSSRVIATYHPAYLLRNPAAKKLVWEDMKMLMREL